MTEGIFPAKNYKKLLDRVKQICRDRRIGDKVTGGGPYRNPLSHYKQVVALILESIKERRHITQNQTNHIGYILRFYQAVVELNSRYKENLANSAISLLEEVVNFAEPRIKGDKPLQYIRAVVKHREGEIREGQYFWDLHLKPASDLLRGLKEGGIDIGDLGQRVDELMDLVRLSLLNK